MTSEPYVPGVRFEADEREALLSVLRHHLSDPRQIELLITPLQRAYGRLLLGDDMTMEEIRRELPRGWYLSPAGRKLKSRPDHEVPITPKCYDNARRKAILARDFAVSARAFATVAVIASLLCGTANAQTDRYGDLEMQNHIETMNWLDQRYDQQMRDIERQEIEDRLQRPETSWPIYLPTTGD